jgi:4-hydroxymandelate oxidase
MIMSTLSNSPLEEVARAATGPLWYQLYVFKDRAVTQALVRRAEESGFDAIAVTVDAPLLGRRERDAHNRFELPDGLALANLDTPEMRRLSSAPAESGLANYFAEMLDQSLTWADLEWLRTVTRLPVLVKGIVRGDDAKRAVEAGASGIIVSNHGGRQLDTSIASIDALPQVVEAVDGAVDVLMDGGVRRGTDVLKALALGAKAVCVGRPVLWGLAVDGEAGVRDVLRILIEEFDLAMALAGCASVEDITRDLIA